MSIIIVGNFRGRGNPMVPHHLNKSLTWQTPLAVQHLLILCTILGIQSHVVDDSQGHEHCSTVVVVTSVSMWPFSLIDGHEPLIEGEDTLDVSLTDTATGGDLSKPHDFDIVLPPTEKLLIGVLSHAVLACHYEVGEAGNLEGGRERERERGYMYL